ncbi:putative complex I intermediate-associated protein 30, mitochondrial [Intoshia linei]|uniref:Putative complex I intermediate-associated protein 30, mitochondrial n=1 Tax=Intoshia linei TaxID=1819745 RepID=A0A177B9Y0_9BILA|nr:putative complex I intermediate-associated protein 30, mitochondrial [Intoshia linei]
MKFFIKGRNILTTATRSLSKITINHVKPESSNTSNLEFSKKTKNLHKPKLNQPNTKILTKNDEFVRLHDPNSPPLKNMTLKDTLLNAKTEFKCFIKEMRENMNYVKTHISKHGDYEILWKFDDKDSCKNWMVTCDKEYGIGSSEATFTKVDGKIGATLQGRLGMDGSIIHEKAVAMNYGWINLRCPLKYQSFHRQDIYDLQLYNTFVIRLRGDGRKYTFLVDNSYRKWDVRKGDQFCYPIYTRGGPLWQICEIPFSKLVLSSSGLIQDIQEVFNPIATKFMGFSLADRIEDDFCLDIDFIGVYYNADHDEYCAYESYEDNL